LPDPERADLVAELLASLDEPTDGDPGTASAQWRDELERRGKRVLTGDSGGEDWDSLRQRLADTLDG